MVDYRQVNRALWDERAPAHAGSPEYGLARYAADPDFLSHVVRFDRPRLGDVAGLRGVHLQCHIGTDTVSLSRLGAVMSGLDFSSGSLDVARELAATTSARIDFYQADVYDAVEVFGSETFDLVYTGVGALCWLPDVAAWGQVVGALLRPGGRFFIREGHPVLWSLAAPRPDGLVVIETPYFQQTEPMVYDEPGTYVSTGHAFTNTVSHDFPHGLGEVVTALLDAGLVITELTEHDSVPWDARPGEMVETDGEWRMRDRPERFPCTYTLQARKP